MKILHIINSLEGGGAEKLLVDLAIEQKKKHEVSIAVLYKPAIDVYLNRLNDEGIEVLILAKKKTFFVPALIRGLMRIIKKDHYDVIHSHLFPSQYYVAALKKMLRQSSTVYITTEHSTSNKRRESMLFKSIEKWVYSAYDKIVCVSEKAEDKLRKHLSDFSPRIITVENGIDIGRYVNAVAVKREQIVSNYHPDMKLLMMVGRFDNPKDQETIIRSMQLLSDNIILLLVGDGSKRSGCEILARDLKVDHRVLFLGFQKDVPGLLKAVDLSVFSSDWEGLPLGVIESMAAGKAIVASDVPGVHEVVNGAGILFEKRNDKALASSIDRLLTNRQLLSEIEQRCLDKSKEYNIKDMVRKYEILYLGNSNPKAHNL